MSKFSLIFILLCLSLPTIQSINIIPDPVNPIDILQPNNALDPQIVIRFQLPTAYMGNYENYDPSLLGSRGLNYKDYLGVVFPTSIGDTDLRFDESIKHTCTLVDDSGNNILLSPAISDISPTNPTVLPDTNIAYCRLDDMSANVPLKTGITYTFTLSLTVKITSTNYVRAVSLITSTSNNPDKIIIDQNPLVGTLGLMNNWLTAPISPLKITSCTVNPTEAAVYPSSQFDMTLSLTVSTFIQFPDSLIVIKYPDNILPPSSVSSNSEPGTLSIENFASGSFLINGFSGTFVPSKMVNLELKGWQALDTYTGSARNIELYVYYRNTYSVLSYSNYAAFDVVSVPISLSVSHPEFWDIYRNGAWPITFSFTSSLSISSGYVMIQHTNALNDGPAGNKISFIASTCSFSDGVISNSFGSRPPCFPLRLDFNYPSSSATIPYKGSGFFFYLKSGLTAGSLYKLTIWAFADNCGGTTTDPVNATSYVVPEFQISIYKTIDATKTNESKFSSSVALAQSSVTQFTGKCWNNRMQSTTAVSPYSFDNTFLHSIKIGAGANSASNPAITMYKEIYDWQIQSQTSSSTCTNCWALSMDNSFGSEQFLYSTTNAIGSSYFLARFSLRRSFTPSNDMLYYYIPFPYTNTAVNVNSNNNLLPGRLVFQFSSQWFDKGDGYKGTGSTCYASWGAYEASGGIGTQKQLLYSTSETASQGSTSNSNFIAANVATGSEIDSDLSLLPPDNYLTGPSNIVRIVSTFNPGTITNNNISWKYMTDFDQAATSSTNDIQVGFFTSCLKWKTTLPSVKSIYTYVDFQVQWRYSATSLDTELGPPINNLRMIKLFPEGGVFQDFSQIVPTSRGSANPFVNHLAYGSSATSNGVCLLEVDSGILQNLANAASNTLILWFMFGMLLESDYSNVASLYPLAPYDVNVKAYGLQSASSMSTDNLFISPQNTGYITLSDILKSINAQVPFSTANTVLNGGSYKSSYLFYMGSSIAFTGVQSSTLTSSSSPSPLLIPYYCPLYISGLAMTGVFPTFMGTWMDMTSYSTINNVEKIITYDDVQTTTQGYAVLLAKSPLKGYGGSLTLATGELATLRWSPYTSATSNILYVMNGSKSSGANSVMTCTGHTLFYSDFFQTDNTISYTAGYSGTQAIFSANNFYVFGTMFNRTLLYGQGSASPSSNMIPVNTNSASTSPVFFTGIDRPEISTLVSDGVFITTDLIGFFCTSSVVTDYNYLTNYYTTISSFVLDWNPDSTSAWNMESIGWDSQVNYLLDPSAGINFKFVPPAQLFNGTQITFASATNSFSVNTKCGLNQASLPIVSECTTNTDFSVTCNIPFDSGNFEICCYNVLINEVFSFSSLYAVFPANPAITGLTSIVSSTIYSAAGDITKNPSSYTFQVDTSSLLDITSTNGVVINEISYLQINHVGAISKARIKLTLPRQPTRNMNLTISGDMSSMYVMGNEPSCSVSFANSLIGSAWDSGDILLDSCSTSDFQGVNPIVITTKNIVYKCGLSYDNAIYITLYPILVVDWNNTPNSFSVYMKTLEGDNLALNPTVSSLTLGEPLDSYVPKLVDQWDYLCLVSSISPRVHSEMANYIFDVDLTVNQNSIQGENLNEMSIYWPIEYYGSYLSNITCSYDNLILSCDFSDEGILNIKYLSDFPIGTSSKISVTIFGVKNPSIDKQFSIPCTINNYNMATGKRQQVIIGSGSVVGGISSNSITTNGGLLFITPTTFILNPNTKYFSTHYFRIGFQFANGFTSPSFTIFGSPTIHIIFPKEYQFRKYSTTPTVTLNQVLSTSAGVLASTPITTSVTVTGNIVQLLISKPNLAISSSTFRYFDISLANIPNSDVARVTMTSPFDAYMTNSAGNLLFRTYSNLNTYSSTPLASPIDTFLAWNRGNLITINSNQILVNVYTDPNNLNVISIQSGRFYPAFFAISRSSPLPFASSTITLTDNIFKMSASSFTLVSAYTTPSKFYIGCPCSTAQGHYYINFSSSDKVYLSNIVPIKVLVNKNGITKTLISVNFPQSIPFHGDALVSMNFPDPNVDALPITWTPAPTNDLDSTLANVTVASFSTSASSYYTRNSTLTGLQTFQASDPNACYTILNSSISMNVTDITEPDLTQYYFKDSFNYFNADTNKEISDKTQVNFTFTPPVVPLFIYCTIKCDASKWVDGSIIISPGTYPTSSTLEFYNSYIYELKPLNFSFSGLIRGLEYSMECLIQSTETTISDIYQRQTVEVKYSSGNLTITGGAKFFKPNNSSNSSNSSSQIYDVNSAQVQIVPSSTIPTTCVEMRFTSMIGLSTQSAIIDYCQSIFSAEGYFENGCQICTTRYLNYTAIGLSDPSVTWCSTQRRIRTLQESTSISTSSNYSSFFVCIISDPQCPTDPSNFNTNLSTFISSVNNSTNIEQNVKVSNVPNVTINSDYIVDSRAPNITDALNITNITFTASNGTYSWIISSPMLLDCYFMVLSNSTPVNSIDDLTPCTMLRRCGNHQVGPTPTLISKTTLMNIGFDATSYNIYYWCYNDIPYATELSNYTVAANYAFPVSNDTYTSSNTSSTGYLFHSPGILLSLLFLFCLIN